MAQKLKNMKYSSVDLVKRGANQKADIKLFKSADDPTEGGETKMNDPNVFEKLVKAIAKAFGVETDGVEDIAKSSLNAAQGEVFDMTYALNESMASIIADTNLNAIRKTEMMSDSLDEFNDEIAKSFDNWAEGQGSVEKTATISNARLEALKSSRDKLDSIIKAAEGDGEGEADDEEEEGNPKVKAKKKPDKTIEKDARSYKLITSKRRSDEEIWQTTSAVSESIRSIVEDSDLTEEQRIEMMKQTIADFAKDATVKIKEWAKVQPASKPDITKGGEETMPIINIDKMAPEDKATLEALKKKYGVVDGEGEEGTVNKEQPTTKPEMDPEVKKAIEELETVKKGFEISNLTGIAKKYEAIGKKADELAPKLYDLKKAGGTAYDDYVAILDEMVETVEKSGIFKEIGSNNSGTGSDLNGIVAEIRKADPSLTQEQAVVKAYESTPGLDPMTGKLK